MTQCCADRTHGDAQQAAHSLVRSLLSGEPTPGTLAHSIYHDAPFWRDYARMLLAERQELALALALAAAEAERNSDQRW